MKTTKWAVVGPGFIAGRFAQGMLEAPGAERTAVVSRSEQNGRAYAEKYGFASSYTDFEKMLRESKPDVVYIATPNDTHMDYVSAALNAGVAVLCEKPMADNAAQTEEMIRLAEKNHTFLMEAMWTRCFPAVRQARQWLQEGKIGQVLTVHSFHSCLHSTPFPFPSLLISLPFTIFPCFFLPLLNNNHTLTSTQLYTHATHDTHHLHNT